MVQKFFQAHLCNRFWRHKFHWEGQEFESPMILCNTDIQLCGMQKKANFPKKSPPNRPMFITCCQYNSRTKALCWLIPVLQPAEGATGSSHQFFETIYLNKVPCQSISFYSNRYWKFPLHWDDTSLKTSTFCNQNIWGMYNVGSIFKTIFSTSLNRDRPSSLQDSRSCFHFYYSLFSFRVWGMYNFPGK